MNQPEQSITVEYDLPHPPKKVWRALTDAKLIATWLMENDFKPEVGHKFFFRAPPQPHWDGKVECEVLEVSPQERLRYSWRGGAGDFRIDTTVTWTLTPTATGTLLKLEHAGQMNQFALDGMGKGWRGHIAERLKKVVAELD
jgi:uncharacterized protein YndB with AHSA1/START domain